MRITPLHLSLHLKNKAPFYVLYGPESFLLEESAKLIRQHCDASVVHDAVINMKSDLDTLVAYLDQPSLFASTLLIDCKIAKFNDAILQKIVQILQANYLNTFFLLQTPHLTRQQQQVLLHLEKGVVVPHFRDLAQFASWIEDRAKRLGVLLTPSLRQALFFKTEGNYLAAAQEIDRLRLLNSEPNDIIEQSQYEVYDLCEALLAKKPERIIKILSCLKDNGVAPQLVIWALTQTLDILLRCASGSSDISKVLRQAGIRSHLQPLYHQALKTPLPFSCSDLLTCLSAADNQVKSGHLTNAWHYILTVCLQMTELKV